MFKNLVETFKKWFKVNQMITEDKIAAAQIAQIFGSELLRVDHNTTERTSATQQATRIDPKQILTQGFPQHNFQNNKEKEMLALLQREAENSYPINEQTISPIQEQHYVQQAPAPSLAQQIAPIAAPAFDSKLQAIFEKINSNLERIANRLDEVDIQVKSKRVSRIK
jgi:hypothetical protein